MPISPRDRFANLFDGGIFVEIDVPKPIIDPLQFKDQKKYPERMKSAQKTTGEAEAMLLAEGEMGRTPVVIAAQDFSFMGGSMGMYVGNAIIRAAERAVELKRPLILFSAAGGARMQEGILSLMQMPRTTVAIQMLKEAKITIRCSFNTSNDRRRYRLLCNAWRYPHCRAKRINLLCRAQSDRTNYKRKTARRVSKSRVSLGPRNVGQSNFETRNAR